MATQVDEDKEKAEAQMKYLEQKIVDAFEIFDHESNHTVDVREIGTIIRSLNCCPTEVEIHDLLVEVEEEEATGYVRLDKFLPVMMRVLLERRYKPTHEDIIQKAFETLDTEHKGYLTRDELVKYITEEGEPFTKEEVEEMLSAAIDSDSLLYYKDFIALLVVPDI